MVELPQCPVCLHAGFTEVFPSSFSGTAREASPYFLTDRQKAVHGRIVRCGGCGFILTSPQFAPDEYAEIYRQVASVERPVGRSGAVLARYRRLGGLVRQFVGKGRFLDFGCGDGGFLACMPEFDGTGLELRPGAIQMPKAGDGGRIIVGELNSAIDTRALEPAAFDFVTAWDVLEHLPHLDDDVAGLRSLLKPGGWFFCTVPNVASAAARISGERWNCYLLEHLWYFAPDTLAMFMQRHGFARRAIRPFLFPADLGTLASRIEQTYQMKLPLPSFLRNFTVPLPAGVMFGAFQLQS